MHPHQLPERTGQPLAETSGVFWHVESEDLRAGQVVLRPSAAYRPLIGGEPVRVGVVGFRIMLLLSSRPYYAFTRRQIADALTAQRTPVSEDAIDELVAKLRVELGVFHDFVQSVPHVGYRFKA